MRILFFPGHPQIFSELIERWISFGHEVMFNDNPLRHWNQKMAKLPAGVMLNSNEKPDIEI